MIARRARQAKKIKPWSKTELEVEMKFNQIHRGIDVSQEDQGLVVKVKVKVKAR